MNTDERFEPSLTLNAILNGRERSGPRYRTLSPFRVTDCGPEEVAFAVKCAHQRRVPQRIEAALAAFADLGHPEGLATGWYDDEHLRWMARATGRPIKRIRAEFAGAQRWLAGAGEWLRAFGEIDSAGQLVQRATGTAYVRGVTTVFVQAGGAAAYKAMGVAHAILAGGSNVVLKTTSHEPLSAMLFARACMERGVNVPQVVHAEARREENRVAIQRAIAQCRQSVVFGEDRTLTSLYSGIPWNPDHRVVPFWTGRSGAVVLDDADLALAAQCLVEGMVSLGRGDDCAATGRVLVPESCAEELAERVTRELQRLKRGAPDDEAADWCPDERRREDVARFFDGAEVFWEDGAVMAFCTPNTRALCEELPYPTLAFQRYRAGDDVAALADRHVAQSPSGRAVATAVFTRNERRFRELAAALSTDKALMNRPTSAYDFRRQHSGHHLCFAMMRAREIVL